MQHRYCILLLFMLWCTGGLGSPITVLNQTTVIYLPMGSHTLTMEPDLCPEDTLYRLPTSEMWYYGAYVWPLECRETQGCLWNTNISVICATLCRFNWECPEDQPYCARRMQWPLGVCRTRRHDSNHHLRIRRWCRKHIRSTPLTIQDVQAIAGMLLVLISLVYVVH